MILIQHVKLYWCKECRGAPYSTIRNKMPKAFNLPKSFFDYNPIGYPSHYVFMIQNKDGIHENINKKYIISEYENIRVGAIEIIKLDNRYVFRYKYDFHRAIPQMHKYNPKISMYVDLEEFAFELLDNEYGQIIYNGRFVDYDTGEWYYNLDILNFVPVDFKKTSLDIFNSKPDKIYKKINILY